MIRVLFTHPAPNPARRGRIREKENRTCHPFTPRTLSTYRQLSGKAASLQLRPDHDSSAQKRSVAQQLV
eukprot:9349066-Pyramimonas_sp.AAC.1